MHNSTSLKVYGAMTVALMLLGCNRPTADGTQPGPDTPAPGELPSAQAPGPLPGQAAGSDADAGPGVSNPDLPAADGSNPILVAAGPTPYLTNRAGTALYFVQGDTDGSACLELCTDVWPPFLVGGTAARPTAAAGLAGDLGTIDRPDGSKQVTYNKHPLYRYAADVGVGRTGGHGVSDKWGQWHLISPQGEAVQGKVGEEAKAPAAAGASGAPGQTPQ